MSVRCQRDVSNGWAVASDPATCFTVICDNTTVSTLICLPIMKKWLFLIVCLIAAPAFAEPWVRYAQESDSARYFDKGRMVNMSGTAFIWDLHDFGTAVTDASGKSYRSVLYPTEFSCRKQQRRLLSVHKMSAAMGAGALVAEHTVVGAWVDVVPQSADDELMKAVCESP